MTKIPRVIILLSAFTGPMIVFLCIIFFLEAMLPGYENHGLHSLLGILALFLVMFYVSNFITNSLNGHNSKCEHEMSMRKIDYNEKDASLKLKLRKKLEAKRALCIASGTYDENDVECFCCRDTKSKNHFYFRNVVNNVGICNDCYSRPKDTWYNLINEK